MRFYIHISPLSKSSIYSLAEYKQGAIDDYTLAIKINPNYAKAYYNRGYVRKDLGDKQGAIDDYNQVIRINPNYAGAYNNRGNVRKDLGDKPGAIEDYTQAIKINPNLDLPTTTGHMFIINLVTNKKPEKTCNEQRNYSRLKEILLLMKKLWLY